VRRLRRAQQLLITSLRPDQADPATLLRLAREHWTIENKVHYVRDVTFNEDAARVRRGHLPQVLASLRNTTLNALRRLGYTKIQDTLVRNSARPFAVLAFLVQ
jgi:hypothetical protein